MLFRKHNFLGDLWRAIKRALAGKEMPGGEWDRKTEKEKDSGRENDKERERYRDKERATETSQIWEEKPTFVIGLALLKTIQQIITFIVNYLLYPALPIIFGMTNI
jgi:hypothetical protein